MYFISQHTARLYGYRCYAKTSFTPAHFNKEDTYAFKKAQYLARYYALVKKQPEEVENLAAMEETSLRHLEAYKLAYVRDHKAEKEALLYDHYSYAERMKHGLI